MFWFFNDREGPNLLIVLVTAVIVHFLSLAAYSLAAYLFNPPIKEDSYTWLSLMIFIQVAIVTIFYFCFK